ncbi:MAG: SCP2 sterol-binding domain-containing protein [Acidobacteriota bacterium]
MSPDVFSQAWIAEWGDELNSSDAYRAAAAAWEGSILFIMALPTGEERLAFLDLWHGDCRAARVASQQDTGDAAFILRATDHDWQRVLSGDIEPIWAMMSGKLKLERGRTAQLVPHAKAAQELVAAARRVDARRQESSP